MNKIRTTLAALSLACLAVFIALSVGRAFADQDYLPQGASVNATRPCNFAGQTAQLVALSATTAATSSATGVGVTRLICNQDAHFLQGQSGVTGPTAGTGATYITAKQPQYVLSTGGKFAFIRDSADGFCYVTDCK